jgi:hypothetical protein
MELVGLVIIIIIIIITTTIVCLFYNLVPITDHRVQNDLIVVK